MSVYLGRWKLAGMLYKTKAYGEGHSRRTNLALFVEEGNVSILESRKVMCFNLLFEAVLGTFRILSVGLSPR